jgi:AAA family ATP:ADP antiporter
MQHFFYNKLDRKEKSFFNVYWLMVCISGFFLSSFDVIVHVKFFEHFGYKYLATTYIFSGATGIILTYLYSLLYKRLTIKKFFFVILSFLILFSATFYILHYYTTSIFVYYAGMVMLFPVNTMFLLILWRFGRKLLFPAKTRIYFPRLRTSYLIGLVTGAGIFTIGLYLVNFNDLVNLSFLSLIFLGPLQLSLLLSHSSSGLPHKEKEKFIPVRHNVFMFFSSKFTLFLFLFAFFSALLGYGIHFTFVNVSWFAFHSVYGMAKFYGLFIAITAIFIFGIDRYLIKRILYSYDSPYSLVLIPFVLVLAIALTIGGNLVAGKAQQFLDRFSVFLILITILKITYFSIIYTVQAPALRTLFHALDLRYKQVAYPRIEGTVVMTGLMFAGGILLALTFLKFFSLVVVLMFDFIVGLGWLWVGVKLIKSYKKALNEEIGKMRIRKTTDMFGQRFEEHLSSFFSGNDFDKIIISMEISKTFQPIVFEHDLIRLLAHPSEKIKMYVLDHIEKECVYDALPELYKSRKLVDSPLKERIQEVIENIERKQDAFIETDEVSEKLFSPDDGVRENLLQAIINSNQEGREGILVTLSKDTNAQIQNRAIKNLARIDSSNYNYTLIDFLYPENYNPYAFEAIASTRNKALEVLERESLLPATDEVVLSRIIRLYGKIGTAEAIAKLLKTLEYSDTFLINKAVEALYENRYQANQKDKFKILGYFVKVMNRLTYNLYTYNLLQENNKARLLRDAYLLETEVNTRDLFRLLSLIYNPNIISSIQEKFLSGSRAEISHAIELTDEYIDEDIKPLFLTIVEDISIADKLKRLDYFFPQRRQKLEEITVSSLTFDFNLLNIYTRTCALILFDYFNIQGFENELIFCASHPELLLSETAKFLIEKRNIDSGSKVKIKPGYKSQTIDEFIFARGYHNLLFSKYFQLKKFDTFKLLNEHIAIELAKSAVEVNLTKGEGIALSDYKEEFALLLTNIPCKMMDNEERLDIAYHFVLIDYLELKGVEKITGLRNGAVWFFSKQTVQTLLYDNIEFANMIISSLEHLKIYPK